MITKRFEELTPEEKEALIIKCVETDMEGLSFEDLYNIAYDTRVREYKENEDLLKEAYDYLDDDEDEEENGSLPKSILKEAEIKEDICSQCNQKFSECDCEHGRD